MIDGNLCLESFRIKLTKQFSFSLIGVAFLGMFLQLPLIAITAPLEKMKLGQGGKVMGNVIFWVSFTIFGQPFAALMYFYAWQAKYGSVSKSMPTLT